MAKKIVMDSRLRGNDRHALEKNLRGASILRGAQKLLSE
jgi:hypothetical protein